MPRLLTPAMLALCTLWTAACAPAEQQVFQATVPPTPNNAPIYTPTPTFTPSPTLTPTLTPTPSPTLTTTPSQTPTASPTLPLLTSTPASAEGAPPADERGAAPLSEARGWSCDDFPCADDIDGFLRRIQVPPGYIVEHAGRFPGQPMQIAYGPDGRLYATVLENGTRTGAVYVLEGDGSAERYSTTLISPVGLAFRPGTAELYVSGRMTPEQGGGVWRIEPGSEPLPVVTDLPCCFQAIDNQPNGLTFGPDGLLYLGVGSVTDQAEPPPGNRSRYTEVLPLEASILRINPHTGSVEVFAAGVRNPYDLAFDSGGRLYASDNGLLSGVGDRLLAPLPGAHYGWPFWRERGCDRCPQRPPRLEIAPDWLTLPPYTLPRGLTVYQGTQFPANMFDNLFVAFWNGIEGGQRIVRIDPRRLPADPESLAAYTPEAFVTGLIRPVDVTVAPDGALVVADFIYGHVWRVRYTGAS